MSLFLSNIQRNGATTLQCHGFTLPLQHLIILYLELQLLQILNEYGLVKHGCLVSLVGIGYQALQCLHLLIDPAPPLLGGVVHLGGAGALAAGPPSPARAVGRPM